MTFVPDTFLARKKGDTITQAELIPVVGCGPRDARYSLRLRQIAEVMMSAKGAASEPCTIAQVRGNLRILTDREASEYNAALSNRAVRQLRSTNRRLADVRVDDFDTDELSRHDRRLSVSGARVALTSGAMVNRMVKLGTHVRVVPPAESYRARK